MYADVFHRFKKRLFFGEKYGKKVRNACYK